MIEIKGINKYYKLKSGQKYHALKGIETNFDRGEFVVVVGRSGSGKSTLLNILGGLDVYDQGEVIIDGISTKNYSSADWNRYRNQKVGFVFQSFNLISHLTVLENVELALVISGFSIEERRRKSLEAIEKVGLIDHINKKPGYLSGGEQQRVAIARAIVNNPDIILADEPTGQLDKKTSVEIMNLIKEVSKGKLVIMVTHMEKLASKYATRLIKISNGTIMEDNKISEIAYDVYEEKKEIEPISFKQMNYLTINNLKRRLKASISLFIMFSIILSLVLTSIMLGKKQVESDLYYIFAPTDPMNLIRITKESNNTFDINEIKRISEISNIQTVIPNFNQRIEVSFDIETEEPDHEQIFKSTNLGLLPESKSNFYLQDQLIHGKYPKEKDEVLITAGGAIELLDFVSENNLRERYRLGVISSTDIWEMIEGRNIVINNDEQSVVRIVGIINKPTFIYGNTIIFSKPELAYELFETDKVSEVNIYLHDIDPYSREETKETISDLSENYIFNQDIETTVSSVYTSLQPIKNFVKALLSVTIVITVIATYVLIHFNLFSREKEVGIYKSLGLSMNNIKKVFAFELIYISLVSCFISYFLATLFINAYVKIVEQYSSTSNIVIESHTIYPDLTSFSLVFLLSILFIYISSILPIHKISKLPAVDILRRKN